MENNRVKEMVSSIGNDLDRVNTILGDLRSGGLKPSATLLKAISSCHHDIADAISEVNKDCVDEEIATATLDLMVSLYEQTIEFNGILKEQLLVLKEPQTSTNQ